MKILKFILLFFLTFNAVSQEITGFVHNNDIPIPNVNILIKDSFVGTQSDENGKFTLEVKKGDFIIISHIKMHTKELEIKKIKNIIVGLDAKVNLLKEIKLISSKKNSSQSKSVYTRYGKINKRNSSFAIYSFDTKEIQRFTSLNLHEALVGRVPNYRLTPDGVFLRGRTGGLKKPNFAIWDIDGMLYEGLPDFLDLSIVKSVHIINSTAGTTLYGLRGTGGVIIVNTIASKKAKKKNYPQLDFIKAEEIDLPNKGNDITEMISKTSGNIDDLKLIAFAYKMNGYPKLALRINRLILAYKPDNITSYRDVAESFLETNKKNKAWDTYEVFIQRNRESINETSFNIMFNDIERLYHSYNLKNIIGNAFVSKKKYSNNYKNETRILFDWSVPTETLLVELVNPEKHTIGLQLGSKFENSTIEEFFIDENLKGNWKLNLSILEDIKLDGYLKVTIYRKWISSEKARPETFFFSLSGATQTEYKLLNLKI